MKDAIEATRQQIERDRRREEFTELFFHGPRIDSAHGLREDEDETV